MILLAATLTAMALGAQARPIFDTISFTGMSINNKEVLVKNNDTFTLKANRLFGNDSTFSSSVKVNSNPLTKGRTVTTNVSVVWNFK